MNKHAEGVVIWLQGILLKEIVMDNRVFDVVEKLAVCQQMCNKCFNACLMEDDVKMMVDCIRLDRQCAEICAFTLSSMATCSCLRNEILALCISACTQCAEECRKHGYIHCQECAEACDDCIQACQSLVDDRNI